MYIGICKLMDQIGLNAPFKRLRLTRFFFKVSKIYAVYKINKYLKLEDMKRSQMKDWIKLYQTNAIYLPPEKAAIKIC